MVPAAGLASAGNYYLSQTIGETMVQIAESSYYILTQGFQQPEPETRIIDDIIPGAFVYPNPVTDFVTIEIRGTKPKNYRIEFLDITGKVFITARKSFGSDYWYREQYNVSSLLGGLYLIRISSEDGLYNKIFKIQKI
jgi:hypothetical protein